MIHHQPYRPSLPQNPPKGSALSFVPWRLRDSVAHCVHCGMVVAGAPFRRTADHSWPRPTATVRRNLQRYGKPAMNPHPGISPAPETATGYCHASPSGDGCVAGNRLSYQALAPAGTVDIHEAQTATVPYSSFYIHHSSLTFTFSAKEKDSETGLSYFGSRYYSSGLSIWLSVDPMSDKYASLSPYVYCANNPVKLVDPNGDSIINPYKRLIDECNAVIMELEEGIKGQKYNYPNLARAALKKTKHKLDEYTKYSRKAEIAISALKEDPDFYNILNNLKDERGTPVDIYIYINPNLPSEKGRNGECIEDVFLLFDSFCGFRNNKIDMILSGYDIGMTACHEGGHLENDVKGFTKQRNWIISHGYANDPNYSGHEDGNPSGEKAKQREREYKQRHNIPYDE